MNNYISARNDLSVYISLFLLGLLAHGSVLEELLLHMIIPISKHAKGKTTNVTNSANYRVIALSSIYGKILCVIILS